MFKSLLLNSLLLGGLLFSNHLLGQALSDIHVLETTSGKELPIGSQLSKQKSILLFLDADCPYVSSYESRIISILQLADSLEYKVFIIDPHFKDGQAINFLSTNEVLKSIDIRQFFDKDKKLTRYFGVSKLPEIVITKPKAAGIQTLYKGAIDDNPQDPSFVTETYAKDILLNRKNENSLKDGVPAMGCHVKKF